MHKPQLTLSKSTPQASVDLQRNPICPGAGAQPLGLIERVANITIPTSDL
jgi:hypothetical protein